MKKRDVFLAGAWAVGTFGLAMAAALPATLNAVDKTAEFKTLPQPVFKVGDIEFTVDVAGKSMQPWNWSPPAGSKVDLTVHATNKSQKDASADFNLTVDQAAVPNPMGRGMTRYSPFWNADQSITLTAGQTKSMQFTTDPVLANRIMRVDIGAGESSLVVDSFIPRPATQPSSGS